MVQSWRRHLWVILTAQWYSVNKNNYSPPLAYCLHPLFHKRGSLLEGKIKWQRPSTADPNFQKLTFFLKTFSVTFQSGPTKLLLIEWSTHLPHVAIFLQPIRTHYAHYGDMTPGREELRHQHLDQWNDTEHRLRCVLQAAARSAYSAKKITGESWRQHFMSGSLGSFHVLEHLQHGRFLNVSFHNPLCEDSNPLASISFYVR